MITSHHLVFGSKAASFNLKQNLVAYYSFDNNVLDSTPNAHNGTTVGSPSYVAGKQSNSINFQNDNTLRYVTVADSTDFSFTNGVNDLPFSISFWVQNLAISSVGNWYVSKRSANFTLGEWQIVYGSAGRIVVNIGSNGNMGANYISAESILNPFGLNTWAYLTITYDGSATASGIKIYVNAVDATSINSTVGTYVRMINTTAELSFGQGLWALNNAIKHRGYLDELAIWKNRLLTLPEIQFLYNSGNGTNYSNL